MAHLCPQRCSQGWNTPCSQKALEFCLSYLRAFKFVYCSTFSINNPIPTFFSEHIRFAGHGSSPLHSFHEFFFLNCVKFLKPAELPGRDRAQSRTNQPTSYSRKQEIGYSHPSWEENQTGCRVNVRGMLAQVYPQLQSSCCHGDEVSTCR